MTTTGGRPRSRSAVDRRATGLLGTETVFCFTTTHLSTRTVRQLLRRRRREISQQPRLCAVDDERSRSNRVCPPSTTRVHRITLCARQRGVSHQPRLCAVDDQDHENHSADNEGSRINRFCAAAPPSTRGSSGPPQAQVDKWPGGGVAGTCASQRDVTVAVMTPVVGGAAAHERGCCEIPRRRRRSSCAQTRLLRDPSLSTAEQLRTKAVAVRSHLARDGRD